jgi:hypothetical protein
VPQFNNGLVPGGAIGTELSALTRRAFIPRLVVQIYKSTPLLSLLMRNAQRAKGGLSQVTVPVQGSSFVSFGYTDYSGTFPQPAEVAAAQNAEFNLKVGVVPIPFMGMEAIIQSSEVVIPRMADAKTVMVQQISTSMYTNNVANPQAVDSLPQAFDNGTNVGTYGGINRNTTSNTFWQSNLKTSAGAIMTRSTLVPYFVQLTKYAGGESADFAVCSMGDWTTLLQDYMSVEQFNTMPGSMYGKDDAVNAGFRGLMLGDTPIFADPFCPTGTMYLFNSRYLAMYISEDAAFEFSGFYSTIPNLQIANIGVLLLAFNLVCTKPSSGYQIQGITGAPF